VIAWSGGTDSAPSRVSQRLRNASRLNPKRTSAQEFMLDTSQSLPLNCWCGGGWVGAKSQERLCIFLEQNLEQKSVKSVAIIKHVKTSM